MPPGINVAPHTRCVDWNVLLLLPFWLILVAPHTRCVDWNALFNSTLFDMYCRTSHEVRGLKCFNWHMLIRNTMSHLTRGAWIEIAFLAYIGREKMVAPHTRCVDWNYERKKWINISILSHLTRGAWIEIFDLDNQNSSYNVAPHTRCVDWNCHRITLLKPSARRTSHEVRGLKCKKEVDKCWKA